jgi:hypothetical protein
VEVCRIEVKLMLAGLTDALGPPLPLPAKVTCWGELPAESTNASVPV